MRSSPTDRAPLGIVRLERTFGGPNCFWMNSSFVGWLTSIRTRVSGLALLVPLISVRAEAAPPKNVFCLEHGDSAFFVPDVSGYLRVFLRAPLVIVQLVRMRFRTRFVLCRAPEHGNAFVLPFIRLLKFHYAVWLVHDREQALRADMARRAASANFSISRFMNRITGCIERSALRHAVAVLANGSQLALKARAAGAANSAILKIISSTLSSEDVKDQGPKRLQIGKPIHLLYVGRIAVEKGLGDLIYAMEKITRKPGVLAKTTLTIVGWDAHGEEQRIQIQIVRSGIKDQVHIAGPLKFGPDLFREFEQADIFVLPSHAEGTPRVLVEAMAFGLPIVATTAGGIPDVIQHEQNGLLVEPGSPVELANAVTKLAADCTMYNQISMNNLLRARSLMVESLTKEMCSFLRARGFAI